MGTFGFHLLTRHAGGVIGNEVVAFVLTLLVSSFSCSRSCSHLPLLLTNAPLRIRDVLPGALLATCCSR